MLLVRIERHIDYDEFAPSKNGQSTANTKRHKTFVIPAINTIPGNR